MSSPLMSSTPSDTRLRSSWNWSRPTIWQPDMARFSLRRSWTCLMSDDVMCLYLSRRRFSFISRQRCTMEMIIGAYTKKLLPSVLMRLHTPSITCGCICGWRTTSREYGWRMRVA